MSDHDRTPSVVPTERDTVRMGSTGTPYVVACRGAQSREFSTPSPSQSRPFAAQGSYSHAPRSKPAPCGTGTDRKSVVPGGSPSGTPTSIAGDPARSLYSTMDSSS